MTTEKQIEANKKNALKSSGAVTEEGKAIVSKNAIKHGIFARDFIITSGDGKKNEEEYKELLDNLIQCLNPDGQLEYLLVEKIAVDFWRLRRVIRFETGSIRQYIDTLIHDYYNEKDCNRNKINKTDEELDKEIAEIRENLEWNNDYIKCLKKGVVSFDKPIWEGKSIECNIEDDLYFILEKISDDVFDEDSFKRFKMEEMDFDEMRNILSKHVYNDKKIAEILIDSLSEED